MVGLFCTSKIRVKSMNKYGLPIVPTALPYVSFDAMNTRFLPEMLKPGPTLLQRIASRLSSVLCSISFPPQLWLSHNNKHVTITTCMWFIPSANKMMDS